MSVLRSGSRAAPLLPGLVALAVIAAACDRPRPAPVAPAIVSAPASAAPSVSAGWLEPPPASDSDPAQAPPSPPDEIPSEPRAFDVRCGSAPPSSLVPAALDLSTCSVASKLDHDVVRVGGPDAHFLVSTKALPSTVSLPRGDGGSAGVEVRGESFVFRGSVTTPSFALASPLVQLEGILRAPRGAVVVAARDEAKGGQAPQVKAMSSLGVAIEVPCDKLVPTVRKAPLPDGRPPPSPLVMASGDGSVALSARPGGPILFRAEPQVIFTRLGKSGDSLRVSLRGWDGTSVVGFVEALTVETFQSLALAGFGHGGCGCGCGADQGSLRSPRARGSPFEGIASVRETAPIFVARSLKNGPWASVTQRASFLVRWAGEGDPWVQIRELPGVSDLSLGCPCGRMAHAFVPRADVSIPDDDP